MVKPASSPEKHLGAIPNACRKLLQIKGSVRAQYKRKKSSLARSLLDYLTSDSFMYGPLLTPLPAKKPTLTHDEHRDTARTGLASEIDEHAGASTVSSLHSPPLTPVSRLGTVSTLTRRFLRRATPNNGETAGEVVPASFEMQHKYREETVLIPSPKPKEKMSDKIDTNGHSMVAEDNEVLMEDDEEDASSKSFTESQSEEVTPLLKDPAMEVVRRVVRKVGGRFSKELGIFVDVRDSEVERWFLATTFLSHPSEFELAKHMFKKLQTMGVSKIQDVLGIDQHELEEAFESVMHNHRIASRLQKIALALHTQHGGGICTLKCVSEYVELKRELESLPGYSRSAARTFLREMRGVWPGATSEFEIRTRNAAKHLHLLPSIRDGAETTTNLIDLAQDTGLDVRDLELALVKVSFQHARHYRNCPGGRECDFARVTMSDLDHLIVNL